MDLSLSLRDRRNEINGMTSSDLKRIQISAQQNYHAKQYQDALELFNKVKLRFLQKNTTVKTMVGNQARCRAVVVTF